MPTPVVARPTSGASLMSYRDAVISSPRRSPSPLPKVHGTKRPHGTSHTGLIPADKKSPTSSGGQGSLGELNTSIALDELNDDEI